MRKDGVLSALTDDAPRDTAIVAAVNRFNKTGEKARAQIVLNLGEEPATLVTSLLMPGAPTRAVWKKLQDTYQKENIQSKLNLQTKIHNIKFDRKSDIQDHMTSLNEIFVALERLNDPLDDKDKPGILLRSLPEEFSFLAVMDD